MDKTTEKLASYVVSLKYEDLTPAVIRETKNRIIDSIGCAMGSYHSEPVRIARKLAAGITAVPSARIWGSGRLTSIDMAAFTNAVMVRYLDLNDTYISKGHGHPSDMIPGVLAVGEGCHATGKEALLALVAAYEVFGASADAFSLSDKGWDHGIFVVLGSVAGAGKILKLTEEQMGHALAIAISGNIATFQTRVGKVSMWKGCAAAASVRAGVFAAFLAKEGMTGPADAFEGKHGIWKQVTGQFELGRLGGGETPFAVERGSNLKYFPAEYHAQAPLWMGLSLREKVLIDDIDAINVSTYYLAYRDIGSQPAKWDPQTRETADHSLPYMLAVALRDGVVTAASFSDERIRDPSLRPLMNRIKISENPEFTRQYPGALLTEIEVVTKDGERYTEQASYPKGHVRNPMSKCDVEKKFNEMCQGVLTLEQCREINNTLWSLEDCHDIAEVLGLVRVSYP